jgi:hypothetical protein
MATAINRAEVKRRVLALCEAHRLACGFSRVSGEYLDWLEAKIQASIVADVHRHPPIGKTFGGPLVPNKSE